MNWNDFKEKVEKWAEERGIYEHSTPEAQLLKALSELGELADAVIKNDREDLCDAIGDVAVCLINYARMAGYETGSPCYDPCDEATTNDLIAACSILIGRHLEGTKSAQDLVVIMCSLVGIAQRENLFFTECCESAWHEIKDRKGRMVPGGAFVKEE